jgi:hypothetical protein
MHKNSKISVYYGGLEKVNNGVPCLCKPLLYEATEYSWVAFTILESMRVGNIQVWFVSNFIMPGHESEGSVIFRNAYKCLPVVTALHGRRLESPPTSLWEIHTFHKFTYLRRNTTFFFLETKLFRLLEILKLYRCFEMCFFTFEFFFQ